MARSSNVIPIVDIDAAFERLARSRFRQKFHLVGKERAYVEMWGIDHVMKQAEALISQRVGPAEPRNDGRQTPWRNHPVFVAQHATGTCCRGCVFKTHGIEKGHAFTREELDYVLAVIRRWIESEMREE